MTVFVLKEKQAGVFNNDLRLMNWDQKRAIWSLRCKDKIRKGDKKIGSWDVGLFAKNPPSQIAIR